MTEMAKIDSIDEKLIKLLQFDARQSSEVLGKQLKISPTTVRRRIRKLLEDGTMRFVAVADPRIWGADLSAHIGLNVDRAQLNPVVKAISSIEAIKNISLTAGRFDMMCFVRVASVEELSNLLRTRLAPIKGITHCETFLCIKDVVNQEALSFDEMERYIE